MSFTSIGQYNESAYRRIFELAQKVKGIRNRTTTSPLLNNKQIVMLIHAGKEPQADAIALKLTTLGCTVTSAYYNATTLKESNLLEDAACSAVFTIGCPHAATLAIAKGSHIPVINVCSSKYSPIRVLADIFPVYEKRDFNFKDVNICWHGALENSAHSWLEAAQVLGFNLTLVPTATMSPDPKIVVSCKQGSSGRITLCKTLSEVKGSDVVINDTLPHDSRRCSVSGTTGGAAANGTGRGRHSADTVADFWDNDLCIIIALMIWIQE